MSSQLEANDSRLLVWADDEKVSNSISVPMSLNDDCLYSCVMLGSAHSGSSNHCVSGAAWTSCINGVESERVQWRCESESNLYKMENRKFQITN